LTFKVNPEKEELKFLRSKVYFDVKTKDLKWIVNAKYPFVVEVLDGFTRREFKDEDFHIKGCTDSMEEPDMLWDSFGF